MAAFRQQAEAIQPFRKKSYACKTLWPQAFAPGVIRTHNLLIRSQMLYPVELRVRQDGKGTARVYKVKEEEYKEKESGSRSQEADGSIASGRYRLPKD
jgi:hypothetical protein